MLGYQGPIPGNQLLDGMSLCLENAEALRRDVEVLLKGTRFSLANYLSVVATEELGKFIILMEAHVLGGCRNWSWDPFWKDFRSHEAKLFAAHAQCLRGPGSTDSRWLGDRRSGLFAGRSKPSPQEAQLFKKKRNLAVLDEKDVSIYVDYNPHYQGGQFISPLWLDFAPQGIPESVSYWVEEWMPRALGRHRTLLNRLGSAEFASAASAAAQAYDAGDSSRFPQVTALILGLGFSEETSS
jgi:AbiV family abortive infection protein